MTTQLRGTDVVIVGMGAAGGVAALPLAEAGLNVVGLEAGTWLDQRDFAPDEIRNNYRDWQLQLGENLPNFVPLRGGITQKEKTEIYLHES